MTDGFAPPPSLDGRSGAPAGPAAEARTPSPTPAGRPPRRRRRRGVVLAWALGGATAVAIVGGVVADLALTAHADRLAPVERGYTGRLESIQAVAGLCLADVADGATAGAATAVPCAEPHHAETVAALRLDGSFPGDDAVARRATEFCAAQVARLVPEDLRASLTWRVWVPTQRTWAADDRQAVCVVVSSSGLVGSIEGGTAAPA